MRGRARQTLLVAAALGLGCGFDPEGVSSSNALGGGPGTSSDLGETEETASDDSTADSNGGTGGGGSTSVGSEEACIDACVPSTPEGWRGPFYVANGVDSTQCPAGYDRQDLVYSGFEAAPASCICACNSTQSSCQVGYRLSNNFTCVLSVSDTVSNDSCDNWDALGADVHIFAELEGAPGTCTPAPVDSVPPVGWGSTATMCAAPARGGDCGDDRCTAELPAELAADLCIARDGEADCPGGDYTQRSLHYRSNQDSRTCGPCTCGGSSACSAQVFAHNSASCGAGGQAVPLNTCTDINVSGSYAISAVIDGEGGCTPSAPAPMGAANPTGPVTVCCAP